MHKQERLRILKDRAAMLTATRHFFAERSILEVDCPLLTQGAPKQPIYYLNDSQHPQPKLHRLLDKGMAVSIGRLRTCPLLDWKFTLLSHNTIRGAAGGAILSAELMVKKGYV